MSRHIREDGAEEHKEKEPVVQVEVFLLSSLIGTN